MIRHHGFCLIAVTLLPLAQGSLLYGSADGGKTCFASNAELNGLMAQAGTDINLGTTPNQNLGFLFPVPTSFNSSSL
jgi:hypothetical protein